MANQIRLKRGSGSDPSASDLTTGELAVRTDTAKLFTKKDDNSVAEIGGGITDLVDDTSPQLGGDLASNGNDIDFADNDKAVFGTGSDLRIFHNGSDSVLQDTGTGNLLFISNQVQIKNAANDETLAKFIENGAVELYYDNSKKIDTTNTGIEVHGKIVADELSLETASSGSQKTLKLVNTNASAGTNEITFNSTTSGTNFEAASIRNGVPNTGNGSLQFKTNNGSGLQSAVVINNDQTTDFNAAIDVTGNITVSGTVDGVDIASLNSTVSGKLSNVVEDTSPQLGGDLQSNGHDIKIADASGYDGNNLYMGSDNDCRIIHDGSNFSITEATGDVTIQAADDIFLKPQAGESGIEVIGNGGVKLYHNNGLAFESNAYGVKVTGGANGNSDSHNGGTVTFDFSSAAYHFVNMNANSTFAAPINALVGHSGTIFLTQDGTGSRTGSFNSVFKFVGGTAPTLSTAANAVDRLDFVCKATDEIHIAVSLDVK